MFKKILAVLTAAVLAAGLIPFQVWAGGESELQKPAAAQYEDACFVSADAGIMTGTDENGYTEKGSVVTVAYDETAFPGYTFDHWEDVYGDKIPKKEFKLIASKDVWFFPVFSDFSGTFGEWELYKSGALCEDGDLYKRSDPVSGLTEYKMVYFNYGSHDFGPYEYVDEDWCHRVCSHCGYEEIEDHWFGTEIIETEATHEHEGLASSTCRYCGATVKRTLPKLTEHVYDNYHWTVVEPSVDGQYGKRSRKCLYCDHEETYRYLQSDFKKLFANRSIRYKETYGGKLEHNEQYYSFGLDDGRTVYIWALQYVYAYSTGNDSGQTFIFMFIDDEDPTTLKPIYLSKTRGDSYIDQFLWAYYGYAYGFEDWLGCLDSIDSLHGYEGGGVISLGNSMSARNSTLYDFSTKWEEEYNNMLIPVTEAPDSFLTTTGEWRKWEVCSDGFSSAATSVCVGEDENGEPVYESFGGFEDCVEYRMWVSGSGEGSDYKKYKYMSCDKNSGITTAIEETTTQYRTSFYFEKVKDVIPGEEYELLDENRQRGFVNVENIETEIRNFCNEQGRGAFYNFSLAEPDRAKAVRVLVNGNYTTSGLSEFWNPLYNPSHVFFVPQSESDSGVYNIKLSWAPADDRAFDYWEIYDFTGQKWELLSLDPDITINTYSDPLTGATYLRCVDHKVEIEGKYTVKVEGGTFQYVTETNTYYFESEGRVPEGAYVCPVEDYDAIPDGMVFDHWRVFIDGVEIEEPEWVTYKYRSCIIAAGDLEFKPVYTAAPYYLSAYADNGEIYYNGEEFYGDEFKAGDVITLTTEGYDGYGYFYGWYRYIDSDPYVSVKPGEQSRATGPAADPDKGGAEEVLIGTDTTLVFTMPASYVQLTAKWGAAETPPDNFHNVHITNGFVYDAMRCMYVTDLRVDDYTEVYIEPDRSLGLDMTEWTVTGELNGEPWTTTVYPWDDGGACFGVWSCEDMPADLTITGAGVPHVHVLSYCKASEPECGYAGWREYWYCTTCYRYFSDENGENEAKFNDLEIPALGHDCYVTEWRWTSDFSGAKVVLGCTRCDEKIKVKADVTSEAQNNKTVYTATAVYEGVTYTDTKEAESAIVYGDASGDGVINGRDVIRLRKFLTEYDPDDPNAPEPLPGADCNGDGVYDGKDLIRLRKYLAGYDDETGTSTVTLGPDP